LTVWPVPLHSGHRATSIPSGCCSWNNSQQPGWNPSR
jgi:hypothetical protein